MTQPYWLRIPGRDMLPQEREYLRDAAEEIAQKFDDPLIVNIGVKGGTSLHCLCIGAPDARFLAIDIDLEYYPIYRPDELPEGIRFVEADSTSYEYDEPIHLAFVDGSHLRDAVEADIKQVVPYVPVGGMLIFHDYAPNARDKRRLVGVRRAVDEWSANATGWKALEATGSLAVFERIA